MLYPFYLGVDLHLKRTYMVLLDAQGETLGEWRIYNDEFEEFLKQFVPTKTFAVLEATRNWPFMYDLLQAHVARVELAHPKELKAISAAAVKTDRVDAHVLAQLARLNYLPTAYAAPLEIRDLRLFLRHRERLIWQRTQAKNRIHAVLASYNLVSPVTDLFGQQGRKFLARVLQDGLRDAACRVIADNLALIDTLDQQVSALEQDLELTPAQQHAIDLLVTMPGVGRVIATTLVAEIGAIQRFASPKALCNWAGLTPRVRSSDALVRHGHISKQGSPFLRAAMTQAAHVACRKSKRWYLVFENLLPRCGKKAAKVAIARRLLTVAYFMLTRDQPYQENYSAAK